jgi:hypothetical protein
LHVSIWTVEILNSELFFKLLILAADSSMDGGSLTPDMTTTGDALDTVAPW